MTAIFYVGILKSLHCLNAILDLRSNEATVRVKRLGGGHMERVSFYPKDSNLFCVYGPEGKMVDFYDARNCAKPFHYIARSHVATADFSPDGSKFLISR